LLAHKQMFLGQRSSTWNLPLDLSAAPMIFLVRN
jgi:hypothetical protein